MPLTQDQLQEIRDIIERHHTALILRMVGSQALSAKELTALENAGLSMPGMDTIQDAYKMGHIMGLLETPEAGMLTLEQYKEHLRTAPLKLTQEEKRAMRAAQKFAAQHIRNLSDRVSRDTGKVITEVEQRAEIREAVSEAIRKRQTMNALASELGERAGQWTRDWRKVAATELQTARQEGIAQQYRSRHGEGVEVFKRPAPGACKHCLRLHIGSDGAPRIYKLSDLAASNVGRRKESWVATRGATHPWCACELSRVPEGWGFNETGQLIPGGDFGIRYADEEEMERAMQLEDELQKAFRIRGHVDIHGMRIAIENPAGSVRRWADNSGNEGETLMQYAYGYIQGTRGADGDEYDVFVGPDPRAEYVYVMHTAKEDSEEYDEDKAMVGFPHLHHAMDSFMEHYDDPSFLQNVSMYTIDEFKEKVFRTVAPDQDGMLKGDLEPDATFVIPAPRVQRDTSYGALEQFRKSTLSHTQIDSHMGNRAVFTGSGGMNVGYQNPLVKPPMTADHPAMSFKPEELQKERAEANDHAREKLKIEGRLETYRTSQGRTDPVVHEIPRDASLRVEAGESARADIPRNRERLDQLNQARIDGQHVNEQPISKGALEVGEVITQNKQHLGPVRLKRRPNDFLVAFEKGGEVVEQLCKSMTAASEYVWSVQKGYRDAQDYRDRTGSSRIPSGAGLKFWGLHKSRALPAGTVREWKGGTFQKQTDGEWKEITQGKGAAQEKSKGQKKKIIVYRLEGAQGGGLEGKNAGNLEGVIKFLDQQSEKGIEHGEYITSYEVSVGDFGTYQRMQGGKPVGGEHGDKVGRDKAENTKWPSEWYSFPKDGNWEGAKKLKSVHLSELDKHAKEQGEFSFAAMGWVAMRDVLKERL